MSDMIYDMPPVLQGSTQRQLQELRNYLVRQARRQGQQASGQSNAAGTGTVVQIGGKAARAAEPHRRTWRTRSPRPCGGLRR